MTWGEAWRPYRSAFVSRLVRVLQYRSAALAGFFTQCWWGGIKVMVLAGFYAGTAPAGGPSMPLAHAVTYVWLAQGLLALLPWSADPEVAQSVRTGAIAYDRLRPVDLYAFWYARSAGWTLARVLPRVALMAVFAAVLLPWLGGPTWSWHTPSSPVAGTLFAVSMLLALLLSTSVVMLLNIATVAALDERGINALSLPIVIVFSGNLLPLSLLRDSWQPLLLAQPLAGLMDIPIRLYVGQLTGWAAVGGLAIQLAWLAIIVAGGRIALGASLRHLQVQGG